MLSVVVEEAADEEEVAEEVEDEVAKQPQQQQQQPDTGGQNILIFQKVTGQDVACISGGVEEHISVAIQVPAPGKMCLPQSQRTNETGTSPVN